MKDPLLHLQMEAATQPLFDRLRCNIIEFGERIADVEKMLTEDQDDAN